MVDRRRTARGRGPRGGAAGARGAWMSWGAVALLLLGSPWAVARGTAAAGVAARVGPAAPVVDDRAKDDKALEKKLRKEFESAYRSRAASERAAAVRTYAERTRELSDPGLDRVIARTLEKAADDDDPAVLGAVADALSWGRDPDIALSTLEDITEELRQEVERLSTRPETDEQLRFRAALDSYARSADALGAHPDDRSVEVLARQMRTLQRRGKVEAAVAGMARPLAIALLRLGSRDAVEVVVKQTNEFSGSAMADGPLGQSRRRSAMILHDALTSFSLEHFGESAPAFDGDTYDQHWRDWFSEHEDDLSEELDELDEPTIAPGRRRTAEDGERG